MVGNLRALREGRSLTATQDSGEGTIRLGIAACGHGVLPQEDRKAAHAALDALLARLDAAEKERDDWKATATLLQQDLDASALDEPVGAPIPAFSFPAGRNNT